MFFVCSMIRFIELREFPGQSKGSFKYFYKGRFFHRDRRAQVVVPTYRCADHENSFCTMSLKGDVNRPLLVREVPENHTLLCRAPDELYPQKEDFKKILKRKAGSCSVRLKKLFDDELGRKDK